MKPSDNALNLVKRFEGLRTEAYVCPAGKWTIGYGHTKDVKRGDVVTAAEAESLLREELGEFGDAVDDLVDVPLSQGQFDAVVSFAYNVGLKAFETSTLRRRLNFGDYAGAAVEFDRWVFAGRKTLPGLVSRRAAERELYLSNG